MLQIYNTLTKQKERFEPMNDKEVRMYVCGPTTYNYFHIGNGRAFLFFDVVRRYLKHLGYEVVYVQNITDIDDKIIAQAIQEDKNIREISEKYVTAFFDDIEKLEIEKGTYNPKATEYVQEMIDAIEKMVDKKVAYEKNGDVFFSVRDVKNYGKLSGKNIDELMAGARVEENAQKKFFADFVLWKKAKPGEPKWDSPWGEGRPGWHTECVVMSQDLLKGTFDIHAGGNDLIFPHHENEIAQAEALTGEPLANYWMHNGFVNIDGEKMSKSLGNFKTVRDILKHFPSEAVRHFYLSKHYRSPIDFSADTIKESDKAMKTLYAPFKKYSLDELETIAKLEALEKWDEKFREYMNDDFNTAKAIALLFDIVREFNGANDEEMRTRLIKTLWSLGNVLGFFQNLEEKLSGDETGELTDELIELLIGYRNRFKVEKNWIMADAIRDDLKKMGIILQDTAEGVKWYIERL
ncbi:MAG: cysteine--tRNA ligase [Candidatus Cloacimonadia bacterium]